jgi:hypothetical protein
VTATLCQPKLSAPPSTDKTQIPHCKTTVLILHTVTKTNPAVITQPSSLFQTGGSGPTSTLNPHRPTPLPAQTPPRFPPLRLFGRLPSERVALSVTGRRPKTLNKTGRLTWLTSRPRKGGIERFGAHDANGRSRCGVHSPGILQRRNTSITPPIRAAPATASPFPVWDRRGRCAPADLCGSQRVSRLAR